MHVCSKESLSTNETHGTKHGDEYTFQTVDNKIDYWQCKLIVVAEVFMRLLCCFFAMVVMRSMLRLV